MCVIAIKPRKVKIDYKTVIEMYDSNPHGAGLAVVCEGATYISKGYESAKNLWEDLKSLQNELLVIHFRWATHGIICPEMTHPFIVDEDINVCTQVEGETHLPVIVHNGVIAKYGNDEISDTADFITAALSRMPDIDNMKKLLELTRSKFALIHDGKIHRVGEFKKYRGLKVSNTDFISRFDFKNYNSGRKYYGTKVYNGKVSSIRENWENEPFVFTERTNSNEKKCYCLDTRECNEVCVQETLKDILARE